MNKKLTVFFVFFVSVVTIAQQQKYLQPVIHPPQIPRGAAVITAGALGLDAKKADGRLSVNFVVPGGPADKAGLHVGDVVTEVDGNSVGDLSDDDFHRALIRHVGDAATFKYLREGREQRATLVFAPRSSVYPEFAKEESLPPGVSELVFSNWAFTTQLSQGADASNSAFLWLQVASKPGSPVMPLNITKFFILDGTDQQLTQVTGEQMKYSIQQWVAQNWRAGTYIAPPPPVQRSYRINSTGTGTYTINDVGGGTSTVSGSGNGTYTVTQEPDYAQLGASLGLAIRQWKDRKHDRKLLEDAQKQIASIDQMAFKAAAPLLPGELRQGMIGYWSGSARPVSPPFKVILFLTEPGTSKEQTVTFEFR